MARVEVRSTGALVNGQYRTVAPRVLRSWLQGTMKDARDYARGIAPVLTGAFRRSIVYRTRQSGFRVEGDLFTTDIPGKAKVIERGFPPARPGLKGRKGVFVFKRTYDRSQGLLLTQGRLLVSELVGALD